MNNQAITIDQLATLSARSADEVRAYLQVKCFDPTHAGLSPTPDAEIAWTQAVEVVIASELHRMCPTRTAAESLKRRVMASFRGSEDLFPDYFTFDPTTNRCEIVFPRDADTVTLATVAYRLTSEAKPHPGQGWEGQEDRGITSFAFSTLHVRQILKSVVEASEARGEPKLPPARG